MRRRRTEALTQAAAYDDLLLLTVKQRSDLRDLLVVQSGNGSWRPQHWTNVINSAHHRLFLLAAANHIRGFVVPPIALAPVLSPSQLAVVEDLRRSYEKYPALRNNRIVWRLPPFDRRQRLKAYAESRIDAIDAVCGLSQRQRGKLLLAAQLDIQNCLDKLPTLPEVAAAGYEVPNRTDNNIQNEPCLLQAMMVDAASSYQKVLHSQLSADQRGKWDRYECERREFQRRAIVEAAVVGFEGAASLTSRQCEELSQKVDNALAERCQKGNNWRIESLSIISQLPPAVFAEMLDAPQQAAVARRQAEIATSLQEFDSKALQEQ